MRTILRFLPLFAVLITTAGAAAQGLGDTDPQDPFTLPDESGPLPLPEENMVEPPAVSDDVPLAPGTAENRLDDLFGKLQKASNPNYAGTLAKSIWNEWFRSGSATIDLMMTWANEAYAEEQYNVALDFLDQVVVRRPDFAEGWNRRATVNYAMNNFAKAMADIQRTLEIEPRHFGAMSGMATILERTGNDEAALKAWQRALAIYPAMKSAQDAVVRLSDELAPDAI